MPNLRLQKYVTVKIADTDDHSGDFREIQAARCANSPLLSGRHPAFFVVTEDTAADDSGLNRAGILRGTNKPTLSTSPVGAAFDDCYDFDGVDLGDDSCGVDCGAEGVGISAAPFTFELWFQADAGGLGRTQILAGKWGGSEPTKNYEIALTDTNKVIVGVEDTTPVTVTVTGTTTIVAGTVYHVALVLNGTTLTLYLNGSSEGTASVTAMQSPDLLTPLWIGRDDRVDAASIYPFDGRIDEVRLSSSARYTSNFTPSTTPFADDADTLGLWHFDAIEQREVYAFGQCVYPSTTGRVMAKRIGNDDSRDVYAIGCCYRVADGCFFPDGQWLVTVAGYAGCPEINGQYTVIAGAGGYWEDLPFTSVCGGSPSLEVRWRCPTISIEVGNWRLDIAAMTPSSSVDNWIWPFDYSTNEVQRISRSGTVTAGTFTLSFDGQGPTSGIPFNATFAQVQSALEGLSNIAPGDVVCTGGPLPTDIDVEFQNTYAGDNVPQMTDDDSGLIGIGATITVSTITQGDSSSGNPPLSFSEPNELVFEPGGSQLSCCDASGATVTVQLV